MEIPGKFLFHFDQETSSLIGNQTYQTCLRLIHPILAMSWTMSAFVLRSMVKHAVFL